MKSSSENHENNNGVSCFANWLGFSLSPHMEMEVSSSPSSSTDLHQQQTQYYHPYLNISEQQQQQQQQQQINSGGGVCFEKNGGFLQTPLTVMPLKSDGSLCIMEALTRSQQSQVPKLEDFLGSGQERETMALSSDSIYYQQQATQQENHRHQQQQQQFDSYLSAMACQGYTDERLFKNWINTVTNLDNNNNNNHNGYVHHNGDDGCSVTLAVAPATHHSGGELQSLSLSMSPGSQSSCVTAAVTTNTTDCVVVDAVVENCKKRGLAKLGHKPQTIHRKSIDTFGQRTSQYRGVTKHRWTGRYEAHLWDNSCKKEGQTRKGRQVYLGGYDMEDKAARAYDLAALKYWGVQTHTNLPVENYKNEIEEMKNMTRQEYVAHLRRKSSGFSRGASIYRGVTRHHQHGRWQARIGRVAGNKDLYLGTFSTQEEAAEAYDVAAIKFRGLNAVTNFDINRYDAEKIMASNALLAGDHAKRNKVERIEAIQDSPSLENAGNCAAANDANASHWKRVLYPGEQQANINACINNGDYPNPSFSLALQDLVRLESTTNPGLQSTKLSSAHFSNASSLVTSLNSSREASPERNGSSSSSSKSLQLPSGFMDHQASVVSPWISSGQLRPVAHLPVFAAWGDA